MVRTDRTDEYERIARETTLQVLNRLAEDAAITADETASTVYWDGDLSAEQVERMRQAIFDLQYATEEYLARFCADTEAWADTNERTPSWRPAEETSPLGSDNGTSSDATDSGGADQPP